MTPIITTIPMWQLIWMLIMGSVPIEHTNPHYRQRRSPGTCQMAAIYLGSWTSGTPEPHSNGGSARYSP